MNGNPVERLELKGPKTQRYSNLRIKPRVGACQQRLNGSIQTDLPAQNAKDQCRGEIAILGRKRRDTARPEQIVRVVRSALNFQQDAEGLSPRR